MDDFFDIYADDLCIPGMTGEKTFLHVSDDHLCIVDDLTPEDEADRLRTREQFWKEGKKGFVGYFGEPWTEEKHAVSTGDAFLRLLGYAEEKGVDAVLSTGDLLEHMHDAGVRFLRRHLADRPFDFLAAPGNHESESCGGVWYAGVQVIEYGDFRVVSVDDRQRTLAPDTLDALEELCGEGKPIVLMMHVPLLTDGNRDTKLGHMEKYYYIDERTCDESGRRLFAILRGTNAVKLILCGHIHGYTVTEPIPGLRQITAPQGMVGGAHLVTVHG